MAMIVISLALIEFGRGLYLYNKISYAVDRAARRGLTHPNVTDQVLKDEILSAFTSAEANPNVAIASEISQPGTSEEVKFRTVTVEIPFKPLVPGLMTDTINMSAARRIPKIP
jgi:Flp pilus assembly protein TadG